MLEKVSINTEPEVIEYIQAAVDYYNSRKPGLGKRFYNNIDKHFNYLKRNYTLFAIRYDDIRCMPVQKFPYMITKQKLISIKAVFCTYENPEKWVERID